MKLLKHLKLMSQLITLALIIGPGISSAATHSLSNISQTAETFVTNQLANNKHKTTITMGRLDPRLRLTQCETPLTAEPLSQRLYSKNVTITIRCDAPKPWTVYVPIKVKTLVPVLVTTRQLVRGVPVQDSDITVEERELTRISTGYFENKEELIGRPAKRRLTKGAVIRPVDMAMNKLIRRGNQVSIITESAGFSVRMPGKALSDAGQGEVIRVENLSSKRTIEGVVLAAGIVKVPM